MRAVGSLFGACGLYLPLFLQQLSMFFLSVLHVDECRDERVLHLLLIVQLLPHRQLIDQLLRERTDLPLHLLQTLQQLRHAQTTQAWDRHQCKDQSLKSFEHKLPSISTAPLFHNTLISTLQFCLRYKRYVWPSNISALKRTWTVTILAK